MTMRESVKEVIEMLDGDVKLVQAGEYVNVVQMLQNIRADLMDTLVCDDATPTCGKPDGYTTFEIGAGNVDVKTVCWKSLPIETDVNVVRKAFLNIRKELQLAGVQGSVHVYYRKGAAIVRVNGEYYDVFNYATHRFLTGCVGDC